MSTKKLERTVIEGGRNRYNTDDRRKSNKEQRATVRDYMVKVRLNPERFDEDPLEDRERVVKEFNDKLGPMNRWLARQVGRVWSEVRSDVFQKFNTSTVAGRHITYDHLLSSIVDTRSGWDSRGNIAAKKVTGGRGGSYYVDELGILCRCPQYRSPYQGINAGINTVDQNQFELAARWLCGRMIGETGGNLHWFCSQDGIWETRWFSEVVESRYGKRPDMPSMKYYCQEMGNYTVYLPDPVYPFDSQFAQNRSGLHWKWIPNPAGFVQRGRLTLSETKQFKRFHRSVQESILTMGNERF